MPSRTPFRTRALISPGCQYSTVSYWWLTAVPLSTGRELPHSRGSPHLIIAGWRTAKAQFPSSMRQLWRSLWNWLKHLLQPSQLSLSPSNLPSFPHSFADAIPKSTPQCNLHSESFSRGPGLQQLLWWPCGLSRIISTVQPKQACLPTWSTGWIPQRWPSFRPCSSALCLPSSESLSSFWEFSLLSAEWPEEANNANGLNKWVDKGAGEYLFLAKPFACLLVLINPECVLAKMTSQHGPRC